MFGVLQWQCAQRQRDLFAFVTVCRAASGTDAMTDTHTKTQNAERVFNHANCVPFSSFSHSLPLLLWTQPPIPAIRTMMSAVDLNLSTAMDGPSGAGKTETCKDLAKAVGKKFVVFNCSNGVQCTVLTTFFKVTCTNTAIDGELNQNSDEKKSSISRHFAC